MAYPYKPFVASLNPIADVKCLRKVDRQVGVALNRRSLPLLRLWRAIIAAGSALARRSGGRDSEQSMHVQWRY